MYLCSLRIRFFVATSFQYMYTYQLECFGNFQLFYGKFSILLELILFFEASRHIFMSSKIFYLDLVHPNIQFFENFRQLGDMHFLWFKNIFKYLPNLLTK